MRHAVLALISLILFLQPAYARSVSPPDTPPPGEETKGPLGTIGIFSVQDTPKSNLIPLARGLSAGARKGFSEAAQHVDGAGWPGSPGACLVCFAFSCVGYPATSTVLGAGKAASVEEAEAIEAPIRKAFSELRIQETMADDILKAAGELKNYTIYPRWQAVSPGSLAYGSFKEDGIDTALEVAVRNVGFAGGIWKNTPAAFLMTLYARLIRTRDNTVLSEHVLVYESPKRSYTEWAQNDGRLFVEEFERGCKNLAEQLMKEVSRAYIGARLSAVLNIY